MDMTLVNMSVDDLLSELGFIKCHENEYGCSYLKKDTGFSYEHKIEISKKGKHKCVVHSFDPKRNETGFNNAISLSYLEFDLINTKIREMVARYGWEIEDDEDQND